MLKTKDLVRISIFSALISISSYISLPLGPVPLTLQSLMVFLSCIILGKHAVYSVLVFFFLGIMGLPVFSDGVNGIMKVFTPSFGFLLGMILSSFVIGRIFDNCKKLDFKNVFGICILGNILIYLIGIPYMAVILNLYFNQNLSFYEMLSKGLFLFIPGDLIKSIIIAIIYKRL